MAFFMGGNIQEFVWNLHCDVRGGNYHAVDIQIPFGVPQQEVEARRREWGENDRLPLHCVSMIQL